MISFVIIKLLIAFVIFFTVNILGGISIGLGYTQIHYQFKRELYPAFNQVFKIITPVLVTIVFAIIFYLTGFKQLNHHLWLSLVLSWIIRLAYDILWGKHSLMNMGIFAFQAITSSAIGIWIYSKLFQNPTLLLPSRDNMVSQAWLIAILFLYKSFEDLKLGDHSSFERKHKYILNMYTNFNKTYGKRIHKLTSDETIVIMAFAIIIVENFNRPKIARFAERVIAPFRKSGTYGLMQVNSSVYLSDVKSIEIGTSNIISLYEKVKTASDTERPKWKNDHDHLGEIVHRTAWLYNNSDDYADEVYNVFNQITAHLNPKPETPPIEKLYNAYFFRKRT